MWILNKWLDSPKQRAPQDCMSRSSNDSMVAGPGSPLGTAEATKMAVVTMDKAEGSGEHWGLWEASLAAYT